MAQYPATPIPNYPLGEIIEHRTLISTFDDLGAEKRRQKWLYPKRIITLKYTGLSQANVRTLWAFYIARGGPYEAFNWFHPRQDTYVGEYVGTGDGSTTVFNLPAKNSSSYTLYADGVAQTAGGTDWTFGSLAGADGADQATMTAAPASGVRLTYDFTGNLKVHCRFADDQASFENFTTTLKRAGIKLQGLLNA